MMRRDWGQLKGSTAGFTGTRDRITAFQRAQLTGFLLAAAPKVVHYGDCLGADYEMFMLCKTYGVRTVCHPPVEPRLRAFTHGDADEVRPVKSYLLRNMDIVVESDYLVACPRQDAEQPRGGTWSTVRYARGLGRTVAVIYPDGRVDIERSGW